MKDEYGALVE